MNERALRPEVVQRRLALVRHLLDYLEPSTSWTRRRWRTQVEVIERDGEIVLRPHVAVPADQAWFWTDRWQQMEREADDAIAAGRVTAVESVGDLLADLDS